MQWLDLELNIDLDSSTWLYQARFNFRGVPIGDANGLNSFRSAQSKLIDIVQMWVESETSQKAFLNFTADFFSFRTIESKWEVTPAEYFELVSGRDLPQKPKVLENIRSYMMLEFSSAICSDE